MKFIIERASEPYDRLPPCDGAVLEEFYNDRWNVVSKFYTITFASYEELINFTKQMVRVIIDWNEDWTGLPSITIYDDYIE